MDRSSIIQSVIQLLSQLDAPHDAYGEQAPTGGEVPIWSKLDAGQLGQGAGAIHDKSGLQAGRQYMNDPGVGNYITDAYGMPMPQDNQGAEGMTMMGLI
jgi:hypothetical protein